MRILVTGAGGFVGKHLVKALEAQGNSVFNWNNFIGLTSFDALIHLAAYAGGLGAHTDQNRMFAENTDLSRRAVWFACHLGIPRFIAMGTVAMYPANIIGSLTEYQIWNGNVHPAERGYSHAKRAMLAQLECSDLDWCMALSTNLYGPGDHFASPHAHVIPMLVHKFKTEDRPVVWGDGTQRRDFLYVEDAVQGLITLLEKGKTGECYNLASGGTTSIGDVAGQLARLSGKPYAYDPTKPVGLHSRSVNSVKLRDLGWAPTVSFEDGLKRTWESYNP